MSGLKKLLSTDLKGVFGGFLKERGLTPGDLEALARFQARLIGESSSASMSLPSASGGAAQTPGGTPLKSDFERTYVDLRVAFANAPDSGNPNQRELMGKRPIWDFLKSPRLVDNLALVVLGVPGSGRSALLQHLTLTLAQGNQSRYDCRAFIPIPMTMSQLVLWEKERQPNLAAGLQALYAKDKELAVPSGWFSHILERADCLLLVDGLDEVPEAQRRAVISFLDKQITTYPRSRFIATARPQGYREVPFKNAWLLELQPLAVEQVRRMIDNSMMTESVDTAGVGASMAPRDRRTLDLLARVRSHPALSSMSQNPLILSTIVRLQREPGGLPPRRVDLYGKLAEALVIHGTRGGKDGFSPQQRLAVFRPLAAHMSKRKLRSLKQADVVKAVSPLFPGSPPAAVENFVKALSTGTGLWLESEPGTWRFIHQALQEYLTAAYFAEKKGPGGPWEELVGDPNWDETLILFSALAEATPVVQVCLQSATVQTLTLATQCLEEATVIAPEVKLLADKVLVESLEISDVRRRHRAAEVLVSRRFKTMQRIDDAKEIDLTYLTCAEFQLFLDDLRANGQYYQPDHWPGTMFVPGTAQQPVTGVRAEDAIDFCWWLTFRQASQGSNFRFRLPRPEEARLFPALTSDQASWCADGDQCYLVGLSPKLEQTLREQMQELPLLTLRPSLVLERSLRIKMEGDFDDELVGSLRLRIESGLAKAVTKIMGTVRNLIMGRACDLGAVITPDLDLARVLARARGVAPLIQALDKIRLGDARRLLQTMLKENDADIGIQRFCNVMMEIVDAVGCQSILDVQQAQRRYLSRMAEYLFYDIPPADAQHKQAVLEYYAWLQLTMARSAGTLLPFEGIRLVREPVGPEGIGRPPGGNFNWLGTS